MEKLLFVILIIICVLIFWQDKRQRAVHWVLFLLLFITSLGIKWEETQFENLLFNVFLIIFLLGTLTLYLTFKNGKLINITHGYFSWGDILFLVAVIPLFETYSFIVFFTMGTLISLMFHITAQIFKPQPTVPFAGYMGLLTIGYLFFETRILDLMTFQR